MNNWILSFFFIFSSYTANALQCVELFSIPTQIEISLLRKSETTPYFNKLRDKSIDKKFYKEVQSVLEEIKINGTKKLTEEQIEVIVEFRQDISFLRSAYEILTEDHKSPKKFNEFVKSFGKLKDLVLMKENTLSKEVAEEILEDVSFKKLEIMLKEEDLANKKSIKIYITEKISTIENLLYKVNRNVDELHTIRKSLRNIYRYMEIQKKIVQMNQSEKDLFKIQLDYLKQLNKGLGALCDKNATDILAGRLEKTDYYEMPVDLYNQIQYFLSKVKILEKEVE